MKFVMEDNKSSEQWRERAYLIASVSLALLSFYIADGLTNVKFWLVVTGGLIASVFAIGNLTRWLLFLLHRPISLLPFQKTALVVSGTMAVVVGTEAFLNWREMGIHAERGIPTVFNYKNVGLPGLALAAQIGLPLAPEAAENIARRSGVLTLPSEWERRLVTIQGAKAAEVWHGVLHVYDENRFRRTTPFPPKRPDTFRVMVVGDSMTYGYGVDERFIYVTLLQNMLGERFNIEVLNLGITGLQSEDILQVIRQFLPKLRPALVFYGVNHNDFLPSQVGQYVSRGLEFPLPDKLKDFLVARSRFARFISDAYDASLRSAGLRADFFDDILRDFDGYQQRFARDVAEMNKFVTAHGLPPIIAMVLDQFPAYEGRGHKISKTAEQYMKQAGMDVIETEEYYRRFNGYAFRVSPWEGHADEEGHAIFASMIIPRLQSHPALQPYRKSLPSSGQLTGEEAIVGFSRRELA